MVQKLRLYQTKNRHIDKEKDTPVDVESKEVLFDTSDVSIPRKFPEAKIQTNKQNK